MEHWRQQRGAFAIFSLPPGLWLLLFFIIPLSILFAYSFGTNAGLTEVAIDGSLANYARALDPVILKVLGKSVAIAALTTLICLVLAFPVALAIVFAGPKWRVWLLLAVMLPFWTNLLIRTYALIAMLRSEGLVNQSLEWLWLKAGWLKALLGFAPLSSWEPLPLLYNNFAVILGLVYIHLPFMVLPLYAALDRLDRALIEASLDLGASQWTTFRRVIIPLALPGIVSGIIITFIPALGAYLTPDLMGGTSSQMVANIIERQFKRANDWPFGAALSFLLVYATFFLFAVQALVERRKARG